MFTKDFAGCCLFSLEFLQGFLLFFLQVFLQQYILGTLLERILGILQEFQLPTNFPEIPSGRTSDGPYKNLREVIAENLQDIFC